jgi:3-oxoacyl-[acyl-carrier protein] reductase
MPDQPRKVALVTGAAAGIGRACAIRFARRGLDVVVNYSRSEKEAREVVGEVEGQGAQALLYQCDVSGNAAVCRMIDAIDQKFGRLDVVVNNAGTTKFIDHRDFDALTEDVWDRILAVNVKGPFFVTRAAAPLMRRGGGGAIVNTSSVAGVSGGGSSIAYAASKGALNTMTKSLARALAPEIRVNTVCPGPVDTRWLKGYEELVKKQLAMTPLGKAATPDDIADTILYLALDTTHTVGQCLVVDGGRTM